MKAYILVDIDENEIGDGTVMVIGDGTILIERLKPLPQKIEGKREMYMPTYSLGWNDCLDAVALGLMPSWEKTE